MGINMNVTILQSTILLAVTQAVKLSTQSQTGSAIISDASAKCLNDILFAGKNFQPTSIGVAQCNFPDGLTPPLESVSCIANQIKIEDLQTK